MHRVIKFSQEIWLSIDMNMELKKNFKSDFERDIFKFMSDAVFGKPWKM